MVNSRVDDYRLCSWGVLLSPYLEIDYKFPKGRKKIPVSRQRGKLCGFKCVPMRTNEHRDS